MARGGEARLRDFKSAEPETVRYDERSRICSKLHGSSALAWGRNEGEKSTSPWILRDQTPGRDTEVKSETIVVRCAGLRHESEESEAPKLSAKRCERVFRKLSVRSGEGFQPTNQAQISAQSGLPTSTQLSLVNDDGGAGE